MSRSLERVRSNAVMENRTPRRSAPANSGEALDAGMLAELGDATLAAMAREELARVIIASGHPWRDNGLEARLPYADRSTLLRMAFLARICSRHRLQLEARPVPIE
jgi:hypothetical protein